MNLQPQQKISLSHGAAPHNHGITTVGIMGNNQAAGFYYYDMPVSINGKQINNSNYGAAA